MPSRRCKKRKGNKGKKSNVRKQIPNKSQGKKPTLKQRKGKKSQGKKKHFISDLEKNKIRTEILSGRKETKALLHGSPKIIETTYFHDKLKTGQVSLRFITYQGLKHPHQLSYLGHQFFVFWQDLNGIFYTFAKRPETPIPPIGYGFRSKGKNIYKPCYKLF